jgi:dienelactone hydrolase
MAMFDRRNVLKVTLGAVSMAPVLVRDALAQAQVFTRGEAEKVLFPAPGLPGGGQLEVRMEVSGENSDPDVAEIARRMKPYNPESYYSEHQRMAEKNEALAQKFEQEGRRVTASEFYLRAAGFWRGTVNFMADTDPRMLPAYNKLKETYEKAYTLVPPPWEKVSIPYEGQTLEGHFYAARQPAGQRAPVVFNYLGADAFLLGGATDGGAGAYRARGMSYLVVDGPGHGGSLRLKKLYATPDSERYTKVVVDYLVSRPDIDANRIGIDGQSMGGYSAPRSVTVEKRIKACAGTSCAYALRDDIFDYYPPIQDRLRWLIGAKTLKEAREKIAEFTIEGRAKQIECALLVGYGIGDRIMDPRGALKLYENATNAKREIIGGFGHLGERAIELRSYFPDWFAKQLGSSGRT